MNSVIVKCTCGCVGLCVKLWKRAVRPYARQNGYGDHLQRHKAAPRCGGHISPSSVACEEVSITISVLVERT